MQPTFTRPSVPNGGFREYFCAALLWLGVIICSIPIILALCIYIALGGSFNPCGTARANRQYRHRRVGTVSFTCNDISHEPMRTGMACRLPDQALYTPPPPLLPQSEEEKGKVSDADLEAGLAVQRTECNQQQSRLFALPAEVRALLWRACVADGNVIPLFCKQKFGSQYGHGVGKVDLTIALAYERLRYNASDHLQLLRSCRRIASEVTDVLVLQSTFAVLSPWSIYYGTSAYLQFTCRLLPQPLVNLRNLYVLASATPPTWPNSRFSGVPALAEAEWEALARLPCLRRLTVDVPHWNESHPMPRFGYDKDQTEAELLRGCEKLAHVPDFRVILHWPDREWALEQAELAKLPCRIVRQLDGDLVYFYRDGETPAKRKYMGNQYNSRPWLDD